MIGLKSQSGFKKSTGLWAELRLDMSQTPVLPRRPLLLLKRSHLIRPSETQLSVMAVVKTPLETMLEAVLFWLFPGYCQIILF